MDPASVSSPSISQDDLNQGSPQSASVPEPPVIPPPVPTDLPLVEETPPPPLPETPLHPLSGTPFVPEVPTSFPPIGTPPPPLPEAPTISLPEKPEPGLGPKQLEETPLPITPSSNEQPLVFRNPNEGGNKPRKPFLIGGAILMFLVFSSALAFYFFQKGGFGIQKKATGCPPATCAGSGYLCASGCDCNWDVNKGVKWHYKCTNGSIERYNELDSSCDSSCPGGGGGGGGGITCGADGSGIWVKNTGSSQTSVPVSWFASYCDRTDCFCSGGPSNETFTLSPGQTITRGFTNSHPACKWSWQTDVTAGSCHQTAHGCASEACVSPTLCKRCSIINGCEWTEFESTNGCLSPREEDVTRTTSCNCPPISGKDNTRCASCVTPTLTPTKIPTPTSAIVTGIATGTIGPVCCCQVGELFNSACAQVQPCTWKSPLLCNGSEEPRDAICCNLPTATPIPTATNTPIPTATNTPIPTATPTKSPLCSAAAQVAAVTSGTGTKITVTSSYGYIDVEIRVTSGGTTTPYQSPTMPSVGTWVWTVPKSLSSITAIAFYVDVSGLGSGGAVCGTWSPPTPTTPLLACVDVQVSVTGGGDLSNLKIGDSLSFSVTFSGTVDNVGIVIKKGGIRVKTLTAGGQRANSWTSPAYTIDSLGSYEILGYIKTNGVWK